MHIFSDGFNFRFDKIHQTILRRKANALANNSYLDRRDELTEKYKSILSNEFNVYTFIELNNINGLQNDLKEVLSDGKILLFLRRVIKILVSVKGVNQFTFKKDTIKKVKCFNEVSILKNKTETSRWIVKDFENIPIGAEAQSELKKDEKIPDKLKKAKFTEISFAARIEKGQVKALKREESLIFTYFPTKDDSFEFPFLVNGNFLTNASREAIHEDQFWNQWIFENIGKKLFDWFVLLSDSEYKNQILHLLPDTNNNIQNELKISFNKSFIKEGKAKAFIPNKNGFLRKASDIIIDKTGLSEEAFVLESDLIEFINKTEKTSLDSESFIHPKIDLKWKLNSLGSTVFDMENLEEFFTDEIFTKTHDLSNNFNLISYFFDKSNRSESQELNEKLKHIPFIFTKGKKLKSPQTLCFPSIDYETDYGENVSVIHPEVYSKIEVEPKVKRC